VTAYQLYGSHAQDYVVSADGREIKRGPDLRAVMTWFTHSLIPGDSIHWHIDEPAVPDDTDDPLKHPCPVCTARKGEQCRNTVHPGQPLPGRRHHYARIEAR
jgi:hypothetical protein